MSQAGLRRNFGLTIFLVPDFRGGFAVSRSAPTYRQCRLRNPVAVDLDFYAARQKTQMIAHFQRVLQWLLVNPCRVHYVMSVESDRAIGGIALVRTHGARPCLLYTSDAADDLLCVD